MTTEPTNETSTSAPETLAAAEAITPAAPAGSSSTDLAQAESQAAQMHAAGSAGEAATEEADGDESGEEEESAAGATEGGAAGAKKRRRRRKKKGAPGEAAPAAARSAERTPFQVGEEVFGRVTAVLDGAIMVDLAGKALAIFDRSEMEPDDLVPAVGDRFVASVLRDGARGGLVVLTRKPLREEEFKPQIFDALANATLIKGVVTGVIKGGVEVSIGGVRAFAPASGMDLHPQNANFTSLLGQILDFKVTQCDAKVRDVVVTRRPLLETEAHERRKQALNMLAEGQVMKGVVRTLVDWGAFVALPEASNLEGLVHISEISHDPRANIQDLLKPGSEIEVKILKIDERGKVWLSHKALQQDPWAEAKAKFKQGSVIKAPITRLESYGVFVKLDEEIEGLLHIADLTAAPQFGFKKCEHPKELVKEGDELEVVVQQFDPRSRKVSLHVALPEGKRGEEPQRVVRSSSLKVEVVRPEGDAGLIVRVLGATGRGSRGFIPAGQTGTPRGTDLRKRFPPGTQLTCKVVDLDPRRMEPKLSLKQQAEDEERNAHREYRKQLAKESSFGTLGDLLAQKLRPS